MGSIWHAWGGLASALERASGPGAAPRLARLLRQSARFALDALLPPQCLNCRTEVDEPGGLCPACWSGLAFITAPYCACCGLPFPQEEPAGALCAECLRRRPRFGRARAALQYDDGSRGLILAFKHGDRTEAAGTFAKWLAQAGAELLTDADLIAPVPLHYSRLLRRRYNQAALLTLRLGAVAGRPATPDLLGRSRATPSQGGLSARQRRRNVAAAFSLRPAYRERVRGARVLLVDDVYTTGATVSSCARALLEAGAAAVDVLTLARVVRPGLGNI